MGRHKRGQQVAFIAMELCQPKDLFEYVMSNDASVTMDQLIDWMIQLAKGLEALVKLNIAHCDIKEANLLMKDEMTIKICDFGVSEFIPRKRTGFYQTGGTMGYQAPECINPKYEDRKHYMKKRDVYAMGCILLGVHPDKPKRFAGLLDRFSHIKSDPRHGKLKTLAEKMTRRYAKDRPLPSKVAKELLSILGKPRSQLTKPKPNKQAFAPAPVRPVNAGFVAPAIVGAPANAGFRAPADRGAPAIKNKGGSSFKILIIAIIVCIALTIACTRYIIYLGSDDDDDDETDIENPEITLPTGYPEPEPEKKRSERKKKRSKKKRSKLDFEKFKRRKRSRSRSQA